MDIFECSKMLEYLFCIIGFVVSFLISFACVTRVNHQKTTKRNIVVLFSEEDESNQSVIAAVKYLHSNNYYSISTNSVLTETILESKQVPASLFYRDELRDGVTSYLKDSEGNMISPRIYLERAKVESRQRDPNLMIYKVCELMMSKSHSKFVITGCQYKNELEVIKKLFRDDYVNIVWIENVKAVPVSCTLNLNVDKIKESDCDHHFIAKEDSFNILKSQIENLI